MSDIRAIVKKICFIQIVLMFQVECPGSIPERVLGNFQVTYYFCAHSLTLGSTQSLTEISTKKFHEA
jgi:hypothetical protein